MVTNEVRYGISVIYDAKEATYLLAYFSHAKPLFKRRRSDPLRYRLRVFQPIPNQWHIHDWVRDDVKKRRVIGNYSLGCSGPGFDLDD